MAGPVRSGAEWPQPIGDLEKVQSPAKNFLTRQLEKLGLGLLKKPELVGSSPASNG